MKKKNKLADKYHTIDSAAERFGCSPQLFRNKIRDREIRYIKVGRLVRIPESALEEFIVDCPTIKEQVQEFIGGQKK